MSQDRLGQLCQRVSGTFQVLESMSMRERERLSSHLRVFTRTPFLAHSTAKLDAMCLTAVAPIVNGSARSPHVHALTRFGRVIGSLWLCSSQTRRQQQPYEPNYPPEEC